MKQYPFPGFPFMLLTLLLIGFIGAAISIWLALLLFFSLILVPASYIFVIHYFPLALTMRGQHQDAIKHYNRLLKLPLRKKSLYMRRAALKNALGDLDGAISDYTSAIDNASEEDPALFGLRSALYLGKRDYPNALEDSNTLLRLQPASEIGYANRAAARMYLGDVDGALADCNKGLEHTKSPTGTALLYNNRGTAYRLTGDFPEAMANYNLAMSTSLTAHEKVMIHPSITTNQGIIYYLQGDYDNARVYFQQANAINPGFYKALVSLAAARFKLGQLDEARKVWNDVIKRDPRYHDAHFLQREFNLPHELLNDVNALITDSMA